MSDYSRVATRSPGDSTIPASVHYSPSGQDDVAVLGRHSSGVVAFDYKNHKPVPLVLNTVYLPPAAPYQHGRPGKATDRDLASSGGGHFLPPRCP